MINFICPVCKNELSEEERLYRCEKGHCFDKSKFGYVNLWQSQKSSAKRHGDDRLMVRARRDFLDEGYYGLLRDMLCEICGKYLELFSLNMEKTPSELSEGMKVKLSLVLALSHGAELLILDEPTSGLDPVSRNELLEIFRHLKAKGISILFSTHIISDLEKCADEITYIRNGKLIYTGHVLGFAGEQVSLEDAMVQYEEEGLYEKFADERV